ncbi:DUF4097 family beta strand repeat-containing protein [Longimicrobium terrae]|uniref:DUF4097 domain-containing protein n=1 Tax=Longimicrobium terrae TaxID=1639882 RepID=A0A841H3Y7_9BACT|nr:DUF4097 family beta strand repeat-containing protein [Longimicrobium terrae]MBB4638316.1 hypothetical protein [Longimicrobium terrae]MBB6072616.1 hypothetical protein [Longimicrobium terrae]NNC28605.1 DUF4097 family beta strand repeat protein [Longimicrobium terrae]
MRHVRMAVMAALAAGMGMAAPADAQREDFRWSGQVARGQAIEVHGISGDVDARPASGDRVEVVGRFTGRDADRLRVEVVQREGRTIICTVYPGNGGTGRGTSPCGNGGGGNGRMNATVNYTVRVPAGVRLVASTVSGDVRADDLRGDVRANTVSGDVRVGTSETASATTVSGDVDVTFGAMSGNTTFSTVSGDVTVRAGDRVNAEVTATTVSGDIDGDFGVERNQSRSPGNRTAHGQIGRGGSRVRISTVNGDINVERAN